MVTEFSVRVTGEYSAWNTGSGIIIIHCTQVINEISPRSKDTIVGLGERLACKIMTAVLRDQGIDAEYVSLEDIVPFDDYEAEEDGSLDQEFYDRLSLAVGERVKQCGVRVPVVTGPSVSLFVSTPVAESFRVGFFGPVPGSLLQQVGRGYTDLLSALLAVGLEASELQIWKEVDGIFTADPRKVPTARLISIISPAEAAELTYYGSEVVHPFTMEQVGVILLLALSICLIVHNRRLFGGRSPFASRMWRIRAAGGR